MTNRNATRARRMWRTARRTASWMVVGSVLPLVWACNARTLGAPDYHPSRSVDREFSSSLVSKLDILFMIDNSQSMQQLQQKLLDQFPMFMDRLKAIPTADGMGTSLPDINVAVVSSDTGAGTLDLPVQGCPFGGDAGRFQFQPRGSCTRSPLHASPTQQTFLSASMNQAVKNYDGDISDAFKCIAALGDKGCGFEGQLKAVRWALDGSNSDNDGFLRADALLAVILITNEDDCSLPDDSTLADPTQNLMTDPLGPLTSFRCNEFGHLCMIDGKLQPPPRGVATNLQGCMSNETPSGKLTKVADEVAFLRGLKPNDPSRIFVAAITGAPTPYSVDMLPESPSSPRLVPTLLHSCTQSGGEYADPAVRIDQWVRAFGGNGLRETICAPTFAPSLDAISDALRKILEPKCVAGTLLDKDPTTAALEPECQVMDRHVDEQNRVIETALPACAVDPTPPCWSLEDNVKGCTDAKGLHVTRNPGPLPDSLHTSISCATCIDGVARAGCPCVVGKEVVGCLP